MSEWIDPALHRALVTEQTDAIRLFTCREGWVERFGADILISYKTDRVCDFLKVELISWAERVDFPLSRVFARFLPKKNTDRIAPHLVQGEPGRDLKGVAMERGLRYGIDFAAGYSVGLFLDQRENRRFVRELAPKSLLNCFAYTCSFSVAGAVAGARTVSIDLSKKSLARGKENFVLNSVSTKDHRFLVDDVMEALPRLVRRGEKFDVVVLDPPTFSRSHSGKAFHVERDLEKLLVLALETAEQGGRILLSTNCSDLDARALEQMARYGLKLSRRGGQFHQEGPSPDFPPGVGASTVWLSLR